jgi:hypothetical protein
MTAAITRRRILFASVASVASLPLLRATHPSRVLAAFQPPWRQPVASSQTLTISTSTIHLDLGEGDLDLSHEAIASWIRQAAEAVARYYGRFPVPAARIFVLPSSGRGVHNGTTWGNVGGSPAFTRIRVGQHTTPQQLNEDWMMTHELIHTALPSLPDKNHWFEEGTAVYVEPIARVQAGQLDESHVWAEMIRNMPQGNPTRGEGGLDQTPNWHRTYWGGAGFCLLADIELRKQTRNRIGLQQALRGIIDAGGTINHDWPIDRTLATADKATNTQVLTQLYTSMGNNPIPIDFNALWTQLGVTPSTSTVNFNDKAPLAEIRKAIFSPPPGSN